MTQTYQLGFTPFATPLQAQKYSATRTKRDRDYDNLHDLMAIEEAEVRMEEVVTVVGFRQKKGLLVLVTPSGKELPWSQENTVKKLLGEYNFLVGVYRIDSKYVLRDHLVGEKPHSVPFTISEW